MTDGRRPDARTERTRAHIKHALSRVIARKGFDALTVSDVSREAGINRGTFYLHFVDKNDMLEQLEGEVISALERVLLEGAGQVADPFDLFSYDKILAALRLVVDDFEFVAAIAGPGGDPEFDSKLRGVMEDLLDRGLLRNGTHLVDDGTFPLAYSRKLAVGHVMTIVDEWLAGGGAEPPEQVARMICAAKDLRPCDYVA